VTGSLPVAEAVQRPFGGSKGWCLVAVAILKGPLHSHEAYVYVRAAWVLCRFGSEDVRPFSEGRQSRGRDVEVDHAFRVSPCMNYAGNMHAVQINVDIIIEETFDA